MADRDDDGDVIGVVELGEVYTDHENAVPGAYVMMWIWVDDPDMACCPECEKFVNKKELGRGGCCPACVAKTDQADSEEAATKL